MRLAGAYESPFAPDEEDSLLELPDWEPEAPPCEEDEPCPLWESEPDWEPEEEPPEVEPEAPDDAPFCKEPCDALELPEPLAEPADADEPDAACEPSPCEEPAAEESSADVRPFAASTSLVVDSPWSDAWFASQSPVWDDH